MHKSGSGQPRTSRAGRHAPTPQGSGPPRPADPSRLGVSSRSCMERRYGGMYCSTGQLPIDHCNHVLAPPTVIHVLCNHPPAVRTETRDAIELRSRRARRAPSTSHSTAASPCSHGAVGSTPGAPQHSTCVRDQINQDGDVRAGRDARTRDARATRIRRSRTAPYMPARMPPACGRHPTHPHSNVMSIWHLLPWRHRARMPRRVTAAAAHRAACTAQP